MNKIELALLIGSLIIGASGCVLGTIGMVSKADPVVPYIGENNNWWIGDQDTGVCAVGKDGQNGIDGKDGQNGKDGIVYAQEEENIYPTEWMNICPPFRTESTSGKLRRWSTSVFEIQKILTSGEYSLDCRMFVDTAFSSGNDSYAKLNYLPRSFTFNKSTKELTLTYEYYPQYGVYYGDFEVDGEIVHLEQVGFDIQAYLGLK